MKRELKKFRKSVNMIFQDPFESLDPRYTVGKSLLEPLLVHGIGSGKERMNRVSEVLEMVELKPPNEFVVRHPYELSGGQRQRVNIARAMMLNPRFVVADEPVSMLDVSIRSGILNLVLKMKEQFGVTFVFITHDLAVARYVSDRIAVMNTGKIVELGPKEDVIKNPHHSYTKLLLSAVPEPDPTIRRSRTRRRNEIPIASPTEYLT